MPLEAHPLLTTERLAFARRVLTRVWGRAWPEVEAKLDDAALYAIFVAAERSVVVRLLAALARESRLPFEDEGSAWRIRAPDVGSANSWSVELPIAGRGAHGLHRWAELDAVGVPRLHDALASLTPVLDDLRDPGNAARIAHELSSSVIQLALARAAAPGRDALRQRNPEDPRTLDPEHWIVDGHPWHPMSRMRSGLTLAAAMRHAPEQLACTHVLAVALPDHLVHRSSAWSENVATILGTSPATQKDRVLLPLHVAQLRRLRADPRRQHLLARATVVDVPGGEHVVIPGLGRVAALRTRSLASLRTVDTDRGAHLKLALDVHTTSTRRIVSPMSVANGPTLTRLIDQVVERDGECAGFELMREDATAGLQPEYFGSLAGEIGAIARPLPSTRRAWVCAALGDRVPARHELPPNDSVLAEWSERYPGSTRRERVRALLDAYVDGLFPWSLRLLVAHGIALELHLQNVLVVLGDDGTLAGFRVRDLGGVRIHGPRLGAAGHAVDFAPGSFIVTDDLAEVRDKWLHTLIHAHLGTVLGLGEGLGASAEVGWMRVRRRIREWLARWAASPRSSVALREAVATDEAALFAPKVRAKALLTMRLRGRSSEYDYVEVENALVGRTREHEGS